MYDEDGNLVNDERSDDPAEAQSEQKEPATPDAEQGDEQQQQPEAGDDGTPEGPATDDGKDAAVRVDYEPQADDLKSEIKKLHDQVSSLHRRLSKQKPHEVKLPDPIDDAAAPKADGYDTVEEYELARSEWEIEKKVTEQVRKALYVDPNDAIQVERDAFRGLIQEAGPKAYKDFVTIVTAEDLPITMDILDAVRQSDNKAVTPVDVLYYLGKNKAETVRISRLNPIQVGREIVKIETKIAAAKSAAPKSKQVKEYSDAPAPVRPTSAAAVIVTKDPNKMTQAEYERWRNGGGGA